MSHGKPNQTHCSECALGTFARNHYFTGKLLVERDFTDEQRYYVDKLRHHHQRLHGWGVVCGLKIKQHPDPACQDRYVIVEPGTAIDCCGHEILVREEVRIPFSQASALRHKKDTGPHTLQICIRYKECPTEEIPVLFDECGCDETRCAPNRILEGYELDVLLADEPPAIDDPRGAHLEWRNTISIAHSTDVALHESTKRLYVINSATPGAIFAVSTENHAIVVPHALGAKGLALAVSNDGTRLFAAVEGPKLLVLDVSKMGQADATVQTLSLDNAAGGPVFLEVAPPADNRLLALFGAPGQVAVWGTDINSAGSPAAPTVISVSPNLRDLVLSTDGTRAYVADPENHKIRVIDVTAKSHNAADDISVTDPISGSPSPTPSSLAIAHSTAGDTLVVGDEAHSKLYFITLNGSQPINAVTLTHSPVALAASPGGNWIYVLERDGGSPEHWFVEPASIYRVQLHLAGTLGPAVSVGDSATELSLSESGRALYVSYEDTPNVAESGGVAVLDVSETDCGDLLWKTLDGCPSCDTGNCVVLATIKNYHLGDKLEDQTDPSTESADDLPKHIARIDNRTGRNLLPSTQLLTEVIQCMLEHSGGGEGKQGPPGLSGQKGDKGDPGQKGDKGDPGDHGTGLNFELPHIVAINWPHNGVVTKSEQLDPVAEMILRDGLIIAFDKEIQPETIRQPTNQGNQKGIPVFEVFKRHKQQEEDFTRCFCSMDGEVLAERAVTQDKAETLSCDQSIVGTRSLQVGENATAARFAIKPGSLGLDLIPGDYRVVVRGDFILGAKKIPLANGVSGYPALDADHLGPGLIIDPILRRCPTGDGVEGGTFESWFTITD